jgi:protein arginine N-methyltransferase 2
VRSFSGSSPNSHTIIEAHTGVLARIANDGWHAKKGVRVCAGKWQEVLPTLIAEGVKFDAIYFDT